MVSKVELKLGKEMSLREVQLSSLEILKEIDKICIENELDYFIMYGTLIGAVRHDGFIPWDDDIDIMMPRDSYNKIIEYFDNQLNGKYNLVNYKNCDNYPYMISRVTDKSTYLKVENEEDYGIGTFIDIYPLDNISNSYMSALLIGRFHGWLSSLFFLSTRKYAPNASNSAKSALKKVAFIVSKMLGKKLLGKLLNKSQRKGSMHGYVGCLQWMTNDFKRNIFKSDVLSGRKRVSFEGVEVNAPVHSHKILSDYYGDYMKMPPVEQRQPHHLYKAFRN